SIKQFMSASWKPYLTDLKRRKSMADIFDEIDEELKKDRGMAGLCARPSKRYRDVLNLPAHA
ncbi:hypothetical protein N9W44_04595, partial [Alphaproteobacteria bacterium]|nr:hypothetical protein [Alphaproteobacteria bacterium]